MRDVHAIITMHNTRSDPNFATSKALLDDTRCARSMPFIWRRQSNCKAILKSLPCLSRQTPSSSKPLLPNALKLNVSPCKPEIYTDSLYRSRAVSSRMRGYSGIQCRLAAGERGVELINFITELQSVGEHRKAMHNTRSDPYFFVPYHRAGVADSFFSTWCRRLVRLARLRSWLKKSVGSGMHCVYDTPTANQISQ